MTEKFNPAPKDKHAEDPKQAQKSDREMHDKLDKALKDIPSIRSRKQRPTGAVKTGCG